jgi:hypothetical protein
MPVDYGFRSGAGRLYQDGYGTVPTNVWGLAIDNFKRELRAMRQSIRYDTYRSIAEAAKPGLLGQASQPRCCSWPRGKPDALCQGRSARPASGAGRRAVV